MRCSMLFNDRLDFDDYQGDVNVGDLLKIKLKSATIAVPDDYIV